VQSDCVCRKHDILILPDSHQSTQILTSLAAGVKSRFTSIYTQAVLFAARVDAEIAVDRIQLFDVHVVDEPDRPHVVWLSSRLGVFVPLGRQRVWDVRAEVWRDGRLVLMIPILNREQRMSRISFHDQLRPVTTVSAVLSPPVISLQSSVTIDR